MDLLSTFKKVSKDSKTSDFVEESLFPKKERDTTWIQDQTPTLAPFSMTLHKNDYFFPRLPFIYIKRK